MAKLTIERVKSAMDEGPAGIVETAFRQALHMWEIIIRDIELQNNEETTYFWNSLRLLVG